MSRSSNPKKLQLVRLIGKMGEQQKSVVISGKS
jgi:hypothetical protein